MTYLKHIPKVFNAGKQGLYIKVIEISFFLSNKLNREKKGLVLKQTLICTLEFSRLI